MLKKIWTKTTFGYRCRNVRLFCSSALDCNDHDEETKNFKLIIPRNYNFCQDCIDQHASGQYGNKTAFWWVDPADKQLQWSFEELSANSKRTANVLNSVGIEKSDRIIVILPKIPEWWLFNLAAIRTGAVLMPGTTLLTPKDIMQRLQKSGAIAIVTDGPTAKKVDEVARFCPHLKYKICVDDSLLKRSDWISYKDLYNKALDSHKCVATSSTDPLQIFFTSGTTGLPKMAEHTHSYALAHTITARYFMDLSAHDVHWNVSDTGWAKSAWSYLFAPWLNAACVFVYNSSRFDATETLQTLERYPVSTFCAAPTSYRMMVQTDLSRFRFSALRHCMSAGEPLNPEVVESWTTATGVTVREGYGQSETIVLSASTRCLPNKAGTMGKPVPGLSVHVIDEYCNEMPPHQEGDIALKVKPTPPGFFTGYVDDSQRTAEALRGDYYVTGDRAIRDEDGYLTFVGRSDDVINSAGYRIGPFEVESALIEHAAVSESAVVSSPDDVRGSIVKAFIILTEQYKEKASDELVKEIQDHVKRTTAPYKYPRKVEFVETLPKTVSGKIRRIELRNREWNI